MSDRTGRANPPENSFCPLEFPTRAGDVHPVIDQMPTGPFDDAGGNRQSQCKRRVVLQPLQVVVDVVGGLPQVLEHIHEILHLGDLELVTFSSGIDLAQQFLLALHQYDPTHLLVRITFWSGSRRTASAKPCSITIPISASTQAQPPRYPLCSDGSRLFYGCTVTSVAWWAAASGAFPGGAA
jgi:hypothetical protein